MHTRRLDADLDLGPCCACGCEGPEVRTLVLLNLKAHIPGTGWGHAATELPENGAIAVLCDDCLDSDCEPTQVIYGFTTNKERRPIEELTELFGKIDSGTVTGLSKGE